MDQRKPLESALGLPICELSADMQEHVFHRRIERLSRGSNRRLRWLQVKIEALR
jgi:hypothetical protein